MKNQVFTFYLIICAIKNAQSDNCGYHFDLSDQCNCVAPHEFNNLQNKSDEKINYRDLNRMGKLEIYLPNLANLDQSTTGNYRIKLKINESVTPDECRSKFVGRIKSSDEQWMKHSEIKYGIESSEHCKSCKNQSVHTAIFYFVFSGCYILEIYDKNDARLHESLPTYLFTSYEKKSLVDKDVLRVQLHLRKKGTELQITVIMNSTDLPKPPSIKSSLMAKHCDKNCLELKAVTKVDHIYLDLKTYNQTFTPCVSTLVSNITWTCNYTTDFYNRTLYTCKYIGLHPGNYSFRFEFLDEHTRCNLDTIWATPSKPCTWFVNVGILKHAINSTEKPYENNESVSFNEYLITGITMLAILIIILTTYFFKYRKPKHPKHSTQLIVNTEILPLCPQEILLIYARDCAPFDLIIESFKHVLAATGKTHIKIHDINSNHEHMLVDPQNWIFNRINNPNTTIILFLNLSGLVIYENQFKVNYIDEKWQDKLFLYAVKQLKTTYTRNYTNLFVAELNNSFYDALSFADLNPAARYIMPNNVDTLLHTIFSDAQKIDHLALDDFRDSCSKCIEFYQKCNYLNDILNIKD